MQDRLSGDSSVSANDRIPSHRGDQPFPSLPAKGPRPAVLLCLIEFIACFSHLLQKGFRSAPPNVSHERTATRGAAGAYAAGVPRVSGTLDCIVRAHFLIFFNTKAIQIKETPNAPIFRFLVGLRDHESLL